MSDLANYWATTRRAIGRRRMLRVTGAGMTLTAVGVACRGSDKSVAPSPASTVAGSAAGTAQAAVPSAKANVSTPSAAKQPKRGGSVTVRMSTEPPNISVFTASAAIPEFFGIAHNKLVRIKSGPELDPADVILEPDLAQALPEQPDELTYVYKMRPGVKFQDVAPANGRDVTVADVKAAIEAFRDDPRSAFRSDNALVSSVETPDAQTVKVTLSKPSAPLLGACLSNRDRQR